MNILAEENSSDVIITVIDSGNGIKEEFLEKLFDPFFTSKPIGEGTGLGLSVAFNIAQNHKGSLTYKLIDNHTAFVLILPKNSKIKQAA